MYYSGSDPYAVRMAFHVGTDEPVEWIFARDLLAAGIESRQGEGDVQVWPSPVSCAETDDLDVIGPHQDRRQGPEYRAVVAIWPGPL